MTRNTTFVCGAVLVVVLAVVLAYCSSTVAPTATVAPTTSPTVVLKTTTTLAFDACQIGDVGPAGGTIFITPSTVGNSTGLYFEVAPPASAGFNGISWATGDNQNLAVPGASGTAIGDGAANTAAIASQVGNVAESSAAVYASEYSLNGFSDWFLPSKDELNELFKTRNSADGCGFVMCWSSSEDFASSAWFQNLRDGDQIDDDYKNNKNDPHCVRPVRAFP